MKNKIFTLTVLCLINCFNARSQWIQTSNPLNGTVRGIVTIGNNLFAATGYGVYFSPDNGETWTLRNGTFPNMEVFSIATNGTDLFAGTGGGFGMFLFKSSDQGLTWVDVTPENIVTYLGHNISAIAIDGTDVYMCSDQPMDGLPGSGFFKSSIAGIDSSTWVPFNTGIPSFFTYVRSLKVNETKIYAGTLGEGVWVSSTTAPGWSSTSGIASDGDHISAISCNGNICFAGTHSSSSSPVLYRSTDNGVNWVPSSTSVFENKSVYAIINNATTVYVGTVGSGILKSTDDGVSWTTFNEGFLDSSGNCFSNYGIVINSFAFKGNLMFAGAGCGVWKRQLAVTPVTPVTPVDSVRRFYPNPADNTITLKVGHDDIGSICIIKNTSGNIVFQRRLTNETTTIDISGLAGGMYFIKIGDQHRQGLRFLKK